MGRIGFLRLLLVTSGIFALVLRCSCVATEITWEVKQRTVNAKWKTETIKLSLDNVEEAFTKGERWLVEVYSRYSLRREELVEIVKLSPRLTMTNLILHLGDVSIATDLYTSTKKFAKSL